MPLRVRLSITLVAIVLVPLTVTAFIVLLMISKQQDARVSDRLSFATANVTSNLRHLGLRGEISASDLVNSGLDDALRRGRTTDVAHATTKFAAKAGIDFIGVVAPDGRVLARTVVRRSRFLPGVPVPDLVAQLPTMARTLSAETSRGVDSFTTYGGIRVTLAGRDVATVVAGYWLDDVTIEELAPNDSHLTLAVGGRASATTEGDGTDLAGLVAVPPGTDVAKVDGQAVASTVVPGGGPTLVVSRARTGEQETAGAWRGLVAILGIFVLMAGLLGWLMARLTTRPLAELAEAALAVAGGRLNTRIEVRSRDEVGRLALAFNTMTDELRTYIQALQDSRDELKRNLTRLGDTLSSTHDLRKMLAVILETAMVTIRAEAGSLMLLSGGRDELYLKVGRGLDGRLANGATRLRIGDGVAGRVAETGEASHGQVGSGDGRLVLAPGEPRADSVIAVPLKSQGRVIGVLNLYDRVDAEEFDDNDLATIRSFANQATVAIDNVLLHQEAQRLSITDGLTGLWNYRYFQMNFDKEIERATRFQRPLALLILDLDKFKSVNDRHGHQRGDAVLVELATRVKGAIREVDTLARYGGEEFVLILPETDLEGATLAAAKICDMVRQRRFGAAGEEPIRVTVSIGVAVFPEHSRSAADLIRCADAALYAAKEAGRDGYWLATPQDAEDAAPLTAPAAEDAAVLVPEAAAVAAAGTARAPGASGRAAADRGRHPRRRGARGRIGRQRERTTRRGRR